MPAWDLGIRVRSLQSYVMALAVVLLPSCSLIESPKEGTEIQSPVSTHWERKHRKRRQLHGIVPRERCPNSTRLEAVFIRMGKSRQPQNHIADPA